MIGDLDAALRDLLRTRMTLLGAGTPAGVAEAQIGFAPPDADWSNDVSAMGDRKALNIYLADLRENRALRSNERIASAQSGVIVREPAPMRVNCHYLVSAWSPSVDRSTRTLDEHEVLAEAMQVLAESQALAVDGHDLPIAVVPPEGFPKLPEFWGTMGQARPWKPVIYLIVTVPVAQPREIIAPEVTTRFTEYRPDRNPGGAELRTLVAGVVRDAGVTPPLPVARAWVQLEETAGKPLQAVRTNANGEFTFADVVPGAYRVRVRSAAHDELVDDPFTVPSPTGRYDLAFP
jgi:hypothetical protein